MALKDTRFFLCKDADSYVKLNVPDQEDRHYKEYGLKLSDCHRSIHWSFMATNPKQRKVSLHKLKKFRDLINELYKELEETK